MQLYILEAIFMARMKNKMVSMAFWSLFAWQFDERPFNCSAASRCVRIYLFSICIPLYFIKQFRKTQGMKSARSRKAFVNVSKNWSQTYKFYEFFAKKKTMCNTCVCVCNTFTCIYFFRFHLFSPLIPFPIVAIGLFHSRLLSFIAIRRRIKFNSHRHATVWWTHPLRSSFDALRDILINAACWVNCEFQYPMNFSSPAITRPRKTQSYTITPPRECTFPGMNLIFLLDFIGIIGRVTSSLRGRNRNCTLPILDGGQMNRLGAKAMSHTECKRGGAMRRTVNIIRNGYTRSSISLIAETNARLSTISVSYRVTLRPFLPKVCKASLINHGVPSWRSPRFSSWCSRNNVPRFVRSDVFIAPHLLLDRSIRIIMLFQ